jgi:hypothetical protein
VRWRTEGAEKSQAADGCGAPFTAVKYGLGLDATLEHPAVSQSSKGAPSPALQDVCRISSIKWLLAAKAGNQASAVNLVIVLARKLRIMPIVSDRPTA